MQRSNGTMTTNTQVYVNDFNEQVTKAVQLHWKIQNCSNQQLQNELNVVLEMLRLTHENNRRRANFCKGMSFFSGFNVGVALGSGGLSIPFAGLVSLGASKNRQKRELEYRRVMQFHLEKLSILQHMQEYTKTVSCVHQSCENLCHQLNTLPSREEAIRHLKMLQRCCPLIEYYVVHDALPHAWEQAKNHFTMAQHTIACNVASTTVYNHNSLEGTHNSLEGLHELVSDEMQQFLHAIFGAIGSIMRARKAEKEAEKLIRDVQKMLDLLQNFEDVVRQLKTMLPPRAFERNLGF